MECHSPYLPPKPYNDLGGADRIRAARDAALYQTPEGIYRVCVGELGIEAAAERRMRHLYARSIRQMDDWVGWLLDALDARGMLDETLVVVTSDHGENLGESSLIGHELSSLTHLPMLVGGALGIADHPWRDDPLLRGYAVSQVAGQVLLPEREMLARGWGVPEEAIRRIADPMSCATDGRYKLVRNGHGEYFYDLQADPGETAGVAADDPATPAATVARMRAAIDDLDAMVPAQAVAPTPPDAEAAALEERLRTLGYI
jgi:arylsulfatase A-like enzyme